MAHRIKRVRMQAKDVLAMSEEGAHELASSPDMRPYLDLHVGLIKDVKDLSAFTDKIINLPLEKRYVWRIASALKWAFADFDSATVHFDMVAFSAPERAEDLKRFMELIQFRPYQFYLFLVAVYGQEKAKEILLAAMEPPEAVIPATIEP
jgi:hypothetical protein